MGDQREISVVADRTSYLYYYHNAVVYLFRAQTDKSKVNYHNPADKVRSRIPCVALGAHCDNRHFPVFASMHTTDESCSSFNRSRNRCLSGVGKSIP